MIISSYFVRRGEKDVLLSNYFLIFIVFKIRLFLVFGCHGSFLKKFYLAKRFWQFSNLRKNLPYVIHNIFNLFFRHHILLIYSSKEIFMRLLTLLCFAWESLKKVNFIKILFTCPHPLLLIFLYYFYNTVVSNYQRASLDIVLFSL